MIELRRTGRWNWALAVTFVLGGLGLATEEHVLVLAATLPLWYVGASALTGMAVPELEIERSIARGATAPGERVDVELTVENVDDEPVTDLRIVDSVPGELAVADGTARGCFTLQPGESRTISYQVSARRGTFEFAPPRLRLRNLTGTAVADITLRASESDDWDATSEDDRIRFAGDRTFECELPVEDVPLADQTLDRSGRVSSDDGGVGIEFHSVRDYQRGDPKRAIDWRRYAKTGELTTVEYDEEHSTTVVILVDARDRTFVSAADDEPAAITLNTFAAERTFDALSARGHEVGLTALAVGKHPLIGPGTGPEIEHRVHEELDTIREKRPRWVSMADDGSMAMGVLDRLGKQLPGDAQVLFFTPAIDDFSEEICRGLLVRGHETTVVSPDVVSGSTPGQQVLAVERAGRLTRLRGAGASVVDWERDRPLQLVLEDALSWGETA